MSEKAECREWTLLLNCYQKPGAIQYLWNGANIIYSSVLLWEMVRDRENWHAAVYGSQSVRHDLATERQPQQVFEANVIISVWQKEKEAQRR